MGITKGDLVFTFDPNSSVNQHVAMVVGWGPYVETWAQLSTVARVQLQANPGPNLVPYIVDHGPQGKYALDFPTLHFSYVVRQGYRPYYALAWPQYNGDSFTWINTNNNARHFIKLPDKFQVPVADIVQPNGTANLLAQMSTVCP
jgi:hypothetical protein